MGFLLDILVFKSINGVFPLNAMSRIQHGDKYDKEHRCYRYDDACGRDGEWRVHAHIRNLVDGVCDQDGNWHAYDNATKTIDGTLLVHHAYEAFTGHTDGAKGGEFSFPKGDGCGDGVKDIGYAYEGNQDDEAV